MKKNIKNNTKMLVALWKKPVEEKHHKQKKI